MLVMHAGVRDRRRDRPVRRRATLPCSPPARARSPILSLPFLRRVVRCPAPSHDDDRRREPGRRSSERPTTSMPRSVQARRARSHRPTMRCCCTRRARRRDPKAVLHMQRAPRCRRSAWPTAWRSAPTTGCGRRFPSSGPRVAYRDRRPTLAARARCSRSSSSRPRPCAHRARTRHLGSTDDP